MKALLLCLALTGCVISPTAVEVDDVEAPVTTYCRMDVWMGPAKWRRLAVDSVRVVGCADPLRRHP